MDAVHEDLNGDIRTTDGTKSATDTSRLLNNLRIEIALRVDFTRHADDVLRTSPDTQLAAFAPIFFYLN